MTMKRKKERKTFLILKCDMSEWAKEREKFLLCHTFLSSTSKYLVKLSAHASTTLSEQCEDDSKKIRIHLYANLLSI